jgi:enoyl-CoA hydratase/carnithine racemase
VAGEGAVIKDDHFAFDAMPGGGATRLLPGFLGYSGALRFIYQSPSPISGTRHTYRLRQ